MEYIQPLITTASAYGETAKTAANLYLTYKYDYQYLEKEIEYAKKYIQIYNNHLSKFELLEKKYEISICSIEKGREFIKDFEVLIKSFESDPNIFIKTTQTVSKITSVNWYREQIQIFLINFNTFIKLIKEDVKAFNKDIEKLRLIKNKNERNEFINNLKTIYSC
jgi:hypothetical protein